LGAMDWLARASLRMVGAIRSHIHRPRLRINTGSERIPRPLRPPRQAATSVATGEPEDPPLEPAGRVRSTGPWKTPPVNLFQRRPGPEPAVGELREQARVIEETLASFSIEVRVVEVNQGPAVTQYGLEPAIGVPV